ncbi:MAG: response regulator [Bdellovibrionota bacterium]|nr:response regulator [Bdellovibrionota bacterium]
MALKSSMRILLTDPSSGNRQAIKSMLGNIGFKNVTEAIDGEKAWQKIEEAGSESPFELIIAAWEIDKISGLDLLKKVRGTGTIAKTKFLMITSEADQQNIVIAVKSGVNNVVVRPFSSNTLMEKIGKIFGA